MANSPDPAPPQLGAAWDGEATTFRLYSRHASAVRLELGPPCSTPPLELHREGEVWTRRVPGAGPGTSYGFRVEGPWAPAAGHLFNPAKRLVDPHARRVTGAARFHPSLRSVRSAGNDLVPDENDSAPYAPVAVVTAPLEPLPGTRPAIPWRDTVIYECHVKGMTALHPGVPAALRGTYLGLCSPPVLEHLAALGVTAVELLPVQPAADNALLADTGQRNYWGYATVAFFAPDARFASQAGREIEEFREMVSAFHDAGIEVLLDVVYNHSGEGGHRGPTLSFRGIDNAAYYRLHPDGTYEDFTGCGNTLDFRNPPVQRLVRDSLVFWARDMGVDGFRFDLAPVLGRTHAGDEWSTAFLESLATDAGLAGIKLIAEPWDLGPGGYRAGHFPAGWSEWNGTYRDTVRRFWAGAGGTSDLATRIGGSSDLFGQGRVPQASINFIACHDGFTLLDLVSYARKHNLANGEGNRDGAAWNESQNFGVEGPSADDTVNAQREQAMRNLVATLAFSLGVPMLNHGDEVARTQNGNNNVWCQDNALSWMPWTGDSRGRVMLAFTRRVLELRRRYGVFRRVAFLHEDEAGHAARARWLRRDGTERTAGDWERADDSFLVVLLRTGLGPEGSPGWVLLALNAGPGDEHVSLPADVTHLRWKPMLDSRGTTHPGCANGRLDVGGRSCVLLEAPDPTTGCQVP